MKYLVNKIKEFAATHTRLLLVIILLFIAGISLPSQAHALDINNLAFFLLSKVAYGISWIISVVLGYFIGFEAWLLGVIINLNGTVAATPVVQIGFPIVLSIANLGFVLAIIIIAYATMFGSGSYGIKQMLWKVVLMAILVNFGLVFATALLQIPQSMTTYFANAINPSTSGEGWSGFADTIAGAFNPQQAFVTKSAAPTEDIGKLDANASADDVTKWMNPFISVIFTVFALLITILSLGLLIATLIIRYVIMALLMVMLPVAWLTWVLPGMKKFGWDKWWDTFFKWAFYPPIVLFFLYLAIASMRVMAKSNAIFVQSSYSGSGVFAGSMVQGIVGNLMQVVVLGGLVIGGIIAASQLQISLASGAKGLVTGAGDKVKGWAKTRAQNAAQNISRRTADRVKNIGLQKIKNVNTGQFESTTLGQRMGAKMQNIPIVSKIPIVGGAMSKAGASLAQSSTVNRQKEIEEAKKKYGALTAEGLVNAYKTASDPVDKAALGQLISNKNWSNANDDWRKKTGLDDIIKESAQISSRIGDAKGAYGAHPEHAEASIEERVLSQSFKDYVAGKRGEDFDTKKLSHDEIVSYLGEIESSHPDLHAKIESDAKIEAIKKATRSIRVSDVPNMSYEAFGGFLSKDYPDSQNLAIVSSMSQAMLGKVPEGDNRSVMAILNTIDKAIEIQNIAEIKDEKEYLTKLGEIEEKAKKAQTEKEKKVLDEYVSMVKRYRDPEDKTVREMFRGLKSNTRFLTSGKAFTWPEMDPAQKEKYVKFVETAKEKSDREAKEGEEAKKIRREKEGVGFTSGRSNK